MAADSVDALSGLTPKSMTPSTRAAAAVRSRPAMIPNTAFLFRRERAPDAGCHPEYVEESRRNPPTGEPLGSPSLVSVTFSAYDPDSASNVRFARLQSSSRRASAHHAISTCMTSDPWRA